MARRQNELPQLRRHKAKNRTYFRFQGMRYYCGPWGAREAEASFRRKVAEIVLPTLEKGGDGNGRSFRQRLGAGSRVRSPFAQA